MKGKAAYVQLRTYSESINVCCTVPSRASRSRAADSPMLAMAGAVRWSQLTGRYIRFTSQVRPTPLVVDHSAELRPVGGPPLS